MAESDASSYFVRLSSGGARPGRRRPEPVVDDHPHRRRRFSVRPLPFLLAALLVWVGWAATTDGGVSARGGDIIDGIRDVLNDATTDPALKRAATYYNTQYESQGSYPRLNDVDAGGAGLGVDIVWCSSNAVVLRGFSGSGTTSRLLLAGHDLGDVHGEFGCPVDLNDPQPWSKPEG